jgi:hypothetical protein
MIVCRSWRISKGSSRASNRILARSAGRGRTARLFQASCTIFSRRRQQLVDQILMTFAGYVSRMPCEQFQLIFGS